MSLSFKLRGRNAPTHCSSKNGSLVALAVIQMSYKVKSQYALFFILTALCNPSCNHKSLCRPINNIVVQNFLRKHDMA